MKKLFTRLYMLWFAYIIGKKLKKLGFRSFMARPFRLDGADNISIGSKTFLQKGAWLYCLGVEGIPGSLTIGSDSIFGYNNHIASVREVIIGNNVLTANNVYISDNMHGYEDINQPIMDQEVLFKHAVSIGDGSWIGENVCIIGAHVGKNCVIGANAVVTSDIPDYSVAVGMPARVIRRYDTERKSWIQVK